MDLRIGVTYSPKELVLEMEGTAEEVAAQLRDALERDDAYLWITDRRGNRACVPREKLAYVEIEGDEGPKVAGFSATAQEAG